MNGFSKQKMILKLAHTGEEHLDTLLSPQARGSAPDESPCLLSQGGTIFM